MKRTQVQGMLGLSAAVLLGQAAVADVETGISSDEVRAIVSEMMADADDRTSLLAANSGHDGHFYIGDGGNFRLQVEGQLQFRYIASFVDDDPVVNSDDFEGGFTATRTELAFSGNVYDPSFLYKISGNFDRNDGDFVLEDAWVGHVFESGLVMIWGQYREPILWEDVINDHHALAVDQSVVNAVFRQDRSQGIWIHKQEEDYRFWAGFSDGIRSQNSDYTMDPADWSFTTRWEYKFDGEWSQFDSFSSAPGSDYGLKLGGGFHWQDGTEDSNFGVGELELGAWTADLMFQGDGWNAFLMGVGLYTDPAGGDDMTDWGALVQGGFFLPDSDWELFARYDVVMPDDDRALDDNFQTLTFGANYYIHGQAAKFTMDFQYFMDETSENALVSDPGNSDRYERIGLLPTAEEGEFTIRAQFQLLF